MKFKARVLMTNHSTLHLDMTSLPADLQLGKEYLFIAEEQQTEPVKATEEAKAFAASVVTTTNPWT